MAPPCMGCNGTGVVAAEVEDEEETRDGNGPIRIFPKGFKRFPKIVPI